MISFSTNALTFCEGKKIYHYLSGHYGRKHTSGHALVRADNDEPNLFPESLVGFFVVRALKALIPVRIRKRHLFSKHIDLNSYKTSYFVEFAVVASRFSFDE